MMKTSTCVFHVMDGEGSCRTSTCVLQLTRWDCFCSGSSSCGRTRRTELRSKSDESPDTVLGLVLALLALLALRGFGGICRIHGVASMLLVFGGKVYEAMPRADSVSIPFSSK